MALTYAQGVPVGVAARPYPGEEVSGDAWLVQDVPEGASIRVAVIDGLGHGPNAAEAAQAAVHTLEAQPATDPATALRACHSALQGTRGAAISVAVLDLGGRTLTYAGVGNIDARLWSPGRSERPISYRGIVGATFPSLRQFELPLEGGWLFVMHSDGVSARFDLDGVRGIATLDAQAIATMLLDGWARATDDATVVVLDGRGLG